MGAAHDLADEDRPPPVVRPAVESDLPPLTAIYNHYVTDTHVTFDSEPFSVDERREWFSHYATSGRHRMLVATVHDLPIGYVTSSRFRVKPGYDPTVETTVYLHPGHTGRGIGRLLYERLFAALADEDVHRAYAGVALPNAASIALHERVGFRHLGTYTEVGRKHGRWVDVAWFERPMP